MEDLRNSCKVNINYHSGTVEAEGTESFIFQVMERVQAFLSAVKTKTLTQHHSEHSGSNVTAEKGKLKEVSTNKLSKSKNKKTVPKIMSDLDLRGDSNKGVLSLKDYFVPFNELNLSTRKLAPVVAHYLREHKSIEEIDENYFYTCLKHLRDNEYKIKIPEKPRQTLIDAKNKDGFFDSTETGGFKLSIAGENFVHDLKHQDKS